MVIGIECLVYDNCGISDKFVYPLANSGDDVFRSPKSLRLLYDFYSRDWRFNVPSEAPEALRC